MVLRRCLLYVQGKSSQVRSGAALSPSGLAFGGEVGGPSRPHVGGGPILELIDSVWSWTIL